MATWSQVPGVQGSREARNTLITLHWLVGAFLELLGSLDMGSFGHYQRLPWFTPTLATANGGHVGVFLWGRWAMAGNL